MKFLRQFMLILVISFIREILKCILHLPIPASIYGFILMFAALETKIIKLNMVKDTAKYLIEIMPLIFIPAAAGLLKS